MEFHRLLLDGTSCFQIRWIMPGATCAGSRGKKIYLAKPLQVLKEKPRFQNGSYQKLYTHTQALVRAPGRSWIRCVLCREKRTLFRFWKCCQRAETRNSQCVDVERPSFQLENPSGISKKLFNFFSKVKKASQATSAGHRPTLKRRQLSTLFQTTLQNLEHVFS